MWHSHSCFNEQTRWRDYFQHRKHPQKRIMENMNYEQNYSSASIHSLVSHFDLSIDQPHKHTHNKTINIENDGASHVVIARRKMKMRIEQMVQLQVTMPRPFNWCNQKTCLHFRFGFLIILCRICFKRLLVLNYCDKRILNLELCNWVYRAQIEQFHWNCIIVLMNWLYCIYFECVLSKGIKMLDFLSINKMATWICSKFWCEIVRQTK